MSSIAATTPAPSAPAVAGCVSGSVRWRSEGAVFELVSSDADLLRMANTVFASPRETSARADLSWIVEPLGTGEGESWVVTLQPHPGEQADRVIRDSRESVLLFVESQALDFLIAHATHSIAVHCALLSREGRGIVIVGPSFAGKSTLAIALWRAGWSLMSDDSAFLHPLETTAAGAPRRVSLRNESRHLVGETLWNEIQHTPSLLRTAKGLFFHPHEVDGTSPLMTTPVASIFFLARRGVAVDPAATERMHQAKAAVALLPYGFNVRTIPFMEGIARITPLVEAVPAYDLGRGDLPEMIRAVESHLG